MTGKQWMIWLAGLIALMAFNALAVVPLFSDDTGGFIGAMLWALMTGLAYGIYAPRYLMRRK